MFHLPIMYNFLKIIFIYNYKIKHLRVGLLMKDTWKLKPLPLLGTRYCMRAAFCDDLNTCLYFFEPHISKNRSYVGFGWSCSLGNSCPFSSHPSTNYINMYTLFLKYVVILLVLFLLNKKCCLIKSWKF